MDVSIIIPTINARPDLLDACVTACRETAPDAELLVMEGGTFAENCGVGAAESSGHILVFLNDDCLPHLTWLYELIAPLERGVASISGARLIHPDGRLLHTGVYFGMEGDILTAYNRTWDVPSGPVDAVTGACLAVKRSTWFALGGFDPVFRNGYEDVDFCLRARQQQYGCWYVAEATVTHYESQSGPARWAHVHDNIRLLNERWSVTSTAE